MRQISVKRFHSYFFSAFLEEFLEDTKFIIYSIMILFFFKCSVILIHKISLARSLSLSFNSFLSLYLYIFPLPFLPLHRIIFFRTCSLQKCHFQPLISSNCNIFKKNIGGENSFFFLKFSF